MFEIGDIIVKYKNCKIYFFIIIRINRYHYILRKLQKIIKYDDELKRVIDINDQIIYKNDKIYRISINNDILKYDNNCIYYEY